MEEIFPPTSRFRILVVADVDLPSVNAFAEKFVPLDHQFDMVILNGPLTHRSPASCEEDLSVIKADIAAIIAQWETVVCRVAFLASDADPTDVLTEQLHLTPNSVNLHARCLPLSKGMFTCGFAETKGNLIESATLLSDSGTSTGNSHDVNGEDENVFENVGFATNSSVEIIGEILDAVRNGKHASDYVGVGDAEPSSSTFASPSSSLSSHTIVNSTSTHEGDSKEGVERVVDTELKVSAAAPAPAELELGIFCLNYKFAFTLNHFLFHIPEELESTGVRVAIIASQPPSPSGAGIGSESTQQRPKLPAKIGNIHIVNCGSLREGAYAVLTVAIDTQSQKWGVESVDYRTI